MSEWPIELDQNEREGLRDTEKESERLLLVTFQTSFYGN